MTDFVIVLSFRARHVSASDPQGPQSTQAGLEGCGECNESSYCTH